MGIGVRVHFFQEDGRIKKIPYTRFDRLLSDGSDERLEAHAGKRVRCAMTFVELHQRKPTKILRTDFKIIPFAANGKVDFEEYRRGQRLAFNMVDLVGLSREARADNVVDLRPRVSRKRYVDEFTWEPTDDEFDRLVREVLPESDV